MSKQRKLRNKLSFAEDEEGADNPPPPPPSAGVKQKKDGSSKAKKSALLSFGDDDDSELSISKSKKDKVKVSKFHRANMPAPATAVAAPSTQSSAGEYTAEKLAALQAATQKLPTKYKPPPTPPADDTRAAITAAAAGAGGLAAGGGGGGGGIKLSGSFKPAAAPKDDRFSYTYSIHGHVKSSKETLQQPPAAAVGQLASGVAAAKISDKSITNGDAQPDDEDMPLPPPPRPGGTRGPAAAATAATVNGAAAAAAAAAARDDGEGANDDEADDEADDEDGSFLPDEETIRMAKAKRERLRQAHLAPDYVPLGGASRLLGAGGLGGLSSTSSKGLAAKADQGSAAAADHDHDQDPGSGSDRDGLGEGSDQEGDLEDTYRMKFVGQQGLAAAAGRKGGSSRRRAAAAAAAASGQYATEVQDPDDDEADDVIDPSTAAAASGDPLLRAIRRNAGGGRAAAGGGSSSWLGGSNRGMSSRMDAIRSAGSGVVAALVEASSRAAARQKHLQGNLSRTAANLTGALEEAERIQADITAASDKYAAVQSLKAYLSDLADCLAVKAPLVEELQESLDAAREEAAAGIRQQQQEDEQILYAQAEAAVAAALNILGNGGTPAAAAAAADTAAADAHESAVAAAAAAASGTQEKDEFGRDLGLWKRKELARGQGRRDAMVAALLQEIQTMREGGRLDLEDDNPAAAAATGSTPAAAAAESEAVQQYKRRRQEILDLAPTVFADTDEQYSSLISVKTKLEGFKALYPKEYNTAYIGDSAAALFAPFVRLELLHWEPLPISSSSSDAAAGTGQQQQQQGGGFDTQDWYQQLFEYGLTAGDDAAAGAGGDDADANLVPQLVESLILPQALHLVAKCWEPCSVSQSKAIVSLVADLFVYVPADKEDMAQLLALTTGSLESAATAAAVPPWPTAAAAASPVAQAVLQLRFRRCAALLRSLLGFKELLSQQLLFQLALQGLVCQQLVPCLRSCSGELGLAVARVEAVVQSLPGSWFKEGSVPREVQPLLDLLGSLGRSVEQQLQQKQGVEGDSSGGGRPGLSYVALGRRVAALLMHVGLMEQAQRLGRLAGA